MSVAKAAGGFLILAGAIIIALDEPGEVAGERAAWVSGKRSGKSSK
ncbi:MAG: hypothetical protein WA532_08535 [Candidatus Korobacteraceae bacterium]